MTSKVNICADLSPEGAACMVLYKLFGWSKEKFENELRQLGEYEIYQKFMQETLEPSSTYEDLEN